MAESSVVRKLCSASALHGAIFSVVRAQGSYRAQVITPAPDKMSILAMPKPVVLVECPPGEYYLRNLEPIRDQADFRIGTDHAFLRQNAADADAMLTVGMRTTALPEIWPSAKNLRWIHSLSAGVEQILFPELITSDIPLTNARGVFKRSLAEFAVLGMLWFAKSVPRLLEQKQAHRWETFMVEWIPERNVAIIGYGEIGQECAKLAKALGAQILATRRRPELLDGDAILDKAFPLSGLHDMLREADYVVLAAPSTPETRGMISDAEFRVMKKSAVIINVGRGTVIDEPALIRALQQDEIAGAALDVFEVEPLPANSPLWDLPNVLISPHCTDRTKDPDWLDLAMRRFVTNFRHFVAGEPLEFVVNKHAGY
jgi:phosphoglycerate dehydrogenase-like enzyme